MRKMDPRQLHGPRRVQAWAAWPGRQGWLCPALSAGTGGATGCRDRRLQGNSPGCACCEAHEAAATSPAKREDV